MAEDHTAARVRSVDEDLEGRVIHESKLRIQLESPFLDRVLSTAVEIRRMAHIAQSTENRAIAPSRRSDANRTHT